MYLCIYLLFVCASTIIILLLCSHTKHLMIKWKCKCKLKWVFTYNLFGNDWNEEWQETTKVINLIIFYMTQHFWEHLTNQLSWYFSSAFIEIYYACTTPLNELLLLVIFSVAPEYIQMQMQIVIWKGASLKLITKLSNIGEFHSKAINLQFNFKLNVNLIVDFLFKVKNVINSMQSITLY